MKKIIVGALVCTGGLAVQAAQAQSVLPVYRITKPGVDRAAVSKLESTLNMRMVENPTRGHVTLLDPKRFLALPMMEAKESDETKRLRAATQNKNPQIPIDMRSIDLAALGKVTAFDEKSALASASRFLEEAGLKPQFGTPMIGHTSLTFLPAGGSAATAVKTHHLDTSVVYKFVDPNGIQFVGPGAQVQLTFDAKGEVSRFRYSAAELEAGESVKLIPGEVIDRQIRDSAPRASSISKRLVYWCPSDEPWFEPNSPAPKLVIPWYAYCTTTQVKNAAGRMTTVKSRIQFIPATSDPRFVPSARLKAMGDGSVVTASVAVTGGAGPYRIIWGGSDPTVSRNNSESIRYTAVRRWAPSMGRGVALARTETVSATVIDSNGVSVAVSMPVKVTAKPIGAERMLGSIVDYENLLASTSPSMTAAGPGSPGYGCESPADPGRWTPCRVGWQNAMFTPGSGSGTQRFCWLADDAWPGDFVLPHPAGSLPAQPWIHGDADFSNWGINTADLVLHIGDGNSDGFTQMQPGGPEADYATGWVNAPVYQPTMNINGNGFGVPAGYNVNYNNSWGPTGPNDTLYWLLMDD
ncbi:MAG TPA: hypothetical protein VKT78_09425, partial [Fimbriimonadaceae bacterium]|nr:hypothetical protein [Fimbriimonadaceae bacterium]